MDEGYEGSPVVRLSAAAALVLASCYLGATAGIWLRFPCIGAAALFPPYAIVTALLWRTSPRSWWIFLLAASAGDFLPHRLGGASVSLVVLAELINHLRAVLAALGLRRFAGRSGRLETMREMVAYLVFAVFVAPGVAALLVAWLVTSHGAPWGFGLIWQEWWLSNAITALTLLPLMAMVMAPASTATAATRPRRGPARRLPVRRIAEATSLALALGVVGAAVLAGATGRSRTFPAHLYWALPFLLWAAVRFGPRGTSATLLGVTSLSIWGAIDGRGPFAGQSSTEDLLELQVFLLAVSVPVLLLSVLIQQQRRTAAALRESRRQYRSIVEDQTELICRFRPDGTYTFANRAYSETFGRAPRDLVGGSIWGLVPAGVHRTRAELEVITRAAPIATREVSVAGEGGATRWLQWRDRAFFDASGAIVEYQAVGRDITDRKLAEDEGRELEARRSVEAALREADRRKDEFLAMLGHELRNPLAPIGVAVELLRRAPPGSRETVWARESIARQLEHMRRLLDDLLDISRITLGKIHLQLEPVDLGRVVANAVETTRPLIDSFGHELAIALPDEAVIVRGDAVRLTQVVANLLNNAARYTDRGGRIAITVGRDGASARLSVRDNGIGLAADALENIFDLFSQTPAGRERAPGGLGIGLTLARRLVKLHDGTVQASSAGPGLGTEIVVRVPALAAARDEAEPASPVAPAAEAPRTSLRILAVDDNVDVADGLASVLGMWGHTVRTAHDGAAALEVATAFAPEVVLLDLGLPRVDGLEVARRLRRTAERSPALLVSMSGFGQEHTRRRSDEAGFHHHLVKPVDMDSLRTLLENCMRGMSRST